MTNLEFLKKATEEQIAYLLAKVTLCGECFLHGKGMCEPHLGCRENFRRWLDSEVEKVEVIG